MVDIGATVESNTVMEVEVGPTVEVGCPEMAMTLPKALGITGGNGLALGMAGVHGVPVHCGGKVDL